MTADDFEGWRAQGNTQEVLAYLKRRREESVNCLVNVCYMAQGVDTMVQATKYASLVEAIDIMLELDFEDLSTEER